MSPSSPAQAQTGSWPCLSAARHRQALRCPWGWWQDSPDGHGKPHWLALGSVPASAVDSLCRQWPKDFERQPTEHGPDSGIGSRLCMTTPAAQRQERLTAIGLALREQGHILAWRDEPYPLWPQDGQGQAVAVIERATARSWGALTLGAHCNGFVADPQTGQPSHLWIARRAWNKPTDPGMLDNLIGGGVPLGQSPREALLREAWEEAGLLDADLAGLSSGSVIELDCDIREGLQREWLHVYDLALLPGRQPQNQDGEVAEFRLMTVAQALAAASSGEMTTDASLATLDFAVRHGLASTELTKALQALQVPAAWAKRFETL